MKIENSHIAVIGLGYVGLPLAVEFGKKFPTIGFDIDTHRIKELSAGHDNTLELSDQDLGSACFLTYSDDIEVLKQCNVYIITVPTPVDKHNHPDLSPLLHASKTVGMVIQPGGLVIYESTVYPGATEEDCIPVIEEVSGLKFNKDFFAGYSPERINPGDKEHRLVNTVKITSGSDPHAAEFVDLLYRQIVAAGTYKASSIKVAEAAKVIENTQRDLNIALINELAIIFNKLGVDTQEVLAAAGTKWNFLKFQPGLVGGHCIGVDPYYLTHKAQEMGYIPEVILAGRRINNGMGEYVANRVARIMTQRRIHIVDARILVLGFSFKENCPDIRNTRVIDIIKEFQGFNAKVDLYDPWVKTEHVQSEYDIMPISNVEHGAYDAIVIAVAHREFRELGVSEIRRFGKPNVILFDVKYLFPAHQVDGRL
ncbi:MAG: Vi polysaccharide biosynthesis UDP-N-acetylglucosamine C-6 dehydrogenase TviB [Turneriella sp.]